MKMRVLISGGGTGGHIFPAIAIAKEIERRYPDTHFLFVGASDRMEMEKIPSAGYQIKGLWITGFKRNFSILNLLLPLKIVFSLIKSFFILHRFKPQIVIGTGGFASGPVLYIASLMGIPTLIQEQNSYPGITNRLLSSRVKSICVAYRGLDRYFPKEKIILTGNPIRKEIEIETYHRKIEVRRLGLNPDKPIVLVIGGSLGAKKLNEVILDNIHWFKNNEVQLIWQTGKLYYSLCKKSKNILGSWGLIQPFINKMGPILSISDIVISRAGAIALSEICCLGKISILVPSPNVAEDHQTKNALALTENLAALMVEEKSIENELFLTLHSLIANNELKNKLSINSKKMANICAAKNIVDQINPLLND